MGNDEVVDEIDFLRRKKKHKVGRNDPCPCGSGKKFKHCHGNLNSNIQTHPKGLYDKINELKMRHEAKELQRKQQQGFGKPIISEVLKGTRFVAVGKRLHWSDKWKTFHDFLTSYVASVFGKEWGDIELKKPLSERHPVCQWYHHLCLIQQQHFTAQGEVYSAPMTGAAAAWLHLAYDLYCLEHNAKVQEKLVSRLKNIDGFRGARYEVFVAAVLIRAGFDIEFENEDDRSTTHCEYTATFKASGNKYSVEAKQRNPTDNILSENTVFRLGRRLRKALKKEAKYPRMIFIDINVPDTIGGKEIPHFLQKALTALRCYEGRTINGLPLPPAYIFVTNYPFEHNLEGVNTRWSALAEGFQIPDFKMGVPFPSIRAAYEARKSHADIYSLLNSLQKHFDIPSTFDGEAPEFVFDEHPPRMIIGETYLIPDDDGNEIPGKLTTATVDVNNGIVYGGYLLNNGKSIIATNPLSEAELQAYKRHPDTFFGVLQPTAKKAETPMDLFDFFYGASRNMSRDKIIEQMKDAPDIIQLHQLSDEKLAFTFAERCTYSVLERTNKGH